MDQEAERRTGRQRRQHTRFGAVEIKGDDRQRSRDDHAHTGRQPIDAVGEVDDVHHHHQSEHRERRAGVGGAGFGEMQGAGEWEGDRLDCDAVVHDHHGSRDLPGELDDRREVEAIVERAHGGDQRRGDQDAVPQAVAASIAGRKERQHRHEHAGEDRQPAEQRSGAAGEATLARFVHGAHGGRETHRQRRQQRGHGRGDEEGVERVDLFQMRHLSSDSIAWTEALRGFRPAAYAAAGALRCSYSG